MRVLVCGSRYWDDSEVIGTVLNGLVENRYAGRELIVIEGEAKGADSMARDWARFHIEAGDAYHVSYEPYPADWETYSYAAGPIRNQQMLDEGQPDVVYAFTDDLSNSKGTADMCRRANKAGVPVYVIGRYGKGN